MLNNASISPITELFLYSKNNTTITVQEDIIAGTIFINTDSFIAPLAFTLYKRSPLLRIEKNL